MLLLLVSGSPSMVVHSPRGILDRTSNAEEHAVRRHHPERFPGEGGVVRRPGQAEAVPEVLPAVAAVVGSADESAGCSPAPGAGCGPAEAV
jgi:hypothetical protein